MLSQSLPKAAPKAQIPAYKTSSGRRVVSAAARGASIAAKEKSSEDVVMADASQPAGPVDSTSGEPSKSTPARPTPLNILKDCVIYVDVRTEDGEDAGSIFVDMLRGLGAKVRMEDHKDHMVNLAADPSSCRVIPDTYCL